MEFEFSEQLGRESYETDGLSQNIPLRRHRDPVSEIKGALKAQRDWDQHVSPTKNYKGGLGEKFSFIRVTVPECLPERLEIISYANEFAFLYDDAMENIDLKHNMEDKSTVQFLETFSEKDLLEKKADSRPEKQLQAQLVANMMAIDTPRAITTMKAWATFVKLSSQTRVQPFETLEEFVPSRVIDAGELIWFGTLTFGMALTIPEEDLAECMELARPGYAALALTNDLYSWDKERSAAEAMGLDYVFNAIWVIMKENGVSEGEAKEICRDEIRKYEAQHCETVERVRGSGGTHLSDDTKRYLEAVMYSISGNLVWSIYCPRYKEF